MLEGDKEEFFQVIFHGCAKKCLLFTHASKFQESLLESNGKAASVSSTIWRRPDGNILTILDICCASWMADSNKSTVSIQHFLVRPVTLKAWPQHAPGIYLTFPLEHWTGWRSFLSLSLSLLTELGICTWRANVKKKKTLHTPSLLKWKHMLLCDNNILKILCKHSCDNTNTWTQVWQSWSVPLSTVSMVSCHLSTSL